MGYLELHHSFDDLFINPDSLPLVFWWVMITKNVDWINYMYYNKQGFVNKTRDAVMGISEQLSATSLMTWQNRLTLDWLKGWCLQNDGGIMCCTFFPNNIAPALTSWFDNMFGQWKNVMITVLWATFTCMTVLVMCGCCVIPCVRGLISRMLEKSMTQQMVGYGPIPSSDQGNDEYMPHDPLDGSSSFTHEEPMFDETIFNV
uniref:Uncharacterized protein n=1 Tax=Hucho hucho TaxID=62062 RepID=A0A4W5LNN4_9TELE